MAAQTKKQQLKEIEYQTRMLNNLKKWIRNLIILSSCGMGIAYWAIKIQEGLMFNIIGGVSIVLVTACVIGCVIIGLALKRRQENANKIVEIVQSEILTYQRKAFFKTFHNYNKILTFSKLEIVVATYSIFVHFLT